MAIDQTYNYAIQFFLVCLIIGLYFHLLMPAISSKMLIYVWNGSTFWYLKHAIPKFYEIKTLIFFPRSAPDQGQLRFCLAWLRLVLFPCNPDTHPVTSPHSQRPVRV